MSIRVEPSKGSYAKEWARWEQRLRVTLFGNADYLNSIQVQFLNAFYYIYDYQQGLFGFFRKAFGSIIPTP